MFIIFMITIFVGLLVIAMLYDVLKMEIPDICSLLLIAFFWVGALFVSLDRSIMLEHLFVAASIFVVGAVLFYFHIWGGGDVKLATAVCLWFGWADLLRWALITALAGGLLAIMIILFRRVRLNENWPNWLAQLHNKDEGMPYGVAIGIGGLFCADRVLSLFQGLI